MEFVVRVKGITGEYFENSASYLNRRICSYYFVFSFFIALVVALLITSVFYDKSVILQALKSSNLCDYFD